MSFFSHLFSFLKRNFEIKIFKEVIFSIKFHKKFVNIEFYFSINLIQDNFCLKNFLILCVSLKYLGVFLKMIFLKNDLNQNFFWDKLLRVKNLVYLEIQNYFFIYFYSLHFITLIQLVTYKSFLAFYQSDSFDNFESIPDLKLQSVKKPSTRWYLWQWFLWGRYYFLIEHRHWKNIHSY